MHLVLNLSATSLGTLFFFFKKMYYLGISYLTDSLTHLVFTTQLTQSSQFIYLMNIFSPGNKVYLNFLPRLTLNIFLITTCFLSSSQQNWGESTEISHKLSFPTCIASPIINIYHQVIHFYNFRVKNLYWYIIITQSPQFTLEFRKKLGVLFPIDLDKAAMTCTHYYGIM